MHTNRPGLSTRVAIFGAVVRKGRFPVKPTVTAHEVEDR
jgi:hypothetical protein